MWLAGSCLAALSQETPTEPPELMALQQSWAAAKEREARPLKEGYLNALTKLRDSLTQAGKLDEAILVRAEIEDLTGVAPRNETVVPERPAQLKSLNEIFRREMAAMTRENDRKYVAALKALKDRFEAASRLEDALRITRELEAVALAAKEGVEQVVTVEAVQNRDSPLETKIRLQAGEDYRIVPNPEDTWTGGGTKAGVWCDYQGYGRASNWMRMYARVGGGKAHPVDPEKLLKAELAGPLHLYAEDGNVGGNKGEIRVTIQTASKARAHGNPN